VLYPAPCMRARVHKWQRWARLRAPCVCVCVCICVCIHMLHIYERVFERRLVVEQRVQPTRVPDAPQQGAAGELLKDAISFPIDTVRTRLMTVGSFTEPEVKEPENASVQPSTGANTTNALSETAQPWPLEDEEDQEEIAEAADVLGAGEGTRRSVLAARRRQKKRFEASVRVAMPIRLRAQIALREGWEASAAAVKRVGKGTQTQVRRSVQEMRDVAQSWVMTQVQQAQNALVASSIANDWRRIQQTRRWQRAAGMGLRVLTSPCVYMYTYLRTCVCVWARTSVSAYVCIHMYAHVNVCVCVCVCSGRDTPTHAYTHSQTT